MGLNVDIPDLDHIQRQLSDLSLKMDRVLATVEPRRELWTTADMAKFHRVKPATIRKWVDQGKVECVTRYGKKMMFEPQS